MKVLHEHVAGIDVHKDMVKVAVRSPGARAWTRKTDILTYRTFYGVLKEMAPSPQVPPGQPPRRKPA